jgi:anti-anti-sigma factor
MLLPHEIHTPPGPLQARLESESLGEWDAESALPPLLELARACGGRDLHLDMSGVRYLGSAALGAFVALNRQVKAGGGRLRLLNVPGPVYEVFALTKLNTLIDVRAAA